MGVDVARIFDRRLFVVPAFIIISTIVVKIDKVLGL